MRDQAGSEGGLSRRAALSLSLGLSGALVCSPLGRAHADDASPETPVRLLAETLASRHLSVKTFINGAGPFAFIVDTGADTSVLAGDVAARLDLPMSDRVMVKGLARDLPATLARVKHLGVGPFAFTDMRLPVLPRHFLFADGFLGLDVIQDRRVTFDFASKALILSPSQPFETLFRGTGAAMIDVTGKDGRLRASDCRVNGVRAKAFIDSGAEVSIGNTALMQALQRRGRLRELHPLVLVGVTGGEVEGRLMATADVRVKNIRFSGALAMADVPSFGAWHLNGEPALLIGMDFLRQFARVSIDYGMKDIRFDLSDAGGQSRQYAML